MTLVRSRHAFTIDLPPSCIVFCPTRPRICLVGTYFLHPAESRSERDAALVGDAIAEGAVEQNAVLDGDNDDNHDDDVDVDNAPAAQRRTGSLILYEVDAARDTVTELSTQSTDFAVLDAKWSPHTLASGDKAPLLAVAASTGLIVLYRLQDATISKSDAVGPTLECEGHDPNLRLEELARHSVADASTLVLSLAWHPRRRDVLGFTQSDGLVRVARLPHGSGTALATAATIHVIDVQQHGLEAWTLAFGEDVDARTMQILSGGDDMALLCSSAAIPAAGSHAGNDGSADDLDNEAPVERWRDRRTHQAGVTAILPLSSNRGVSGSEHDSLVVTGSYDDHIRLLAVAAAGGGRQRPRVLAEAHLGGGVWRLQRLDAASERPGDALLLASCMHAGARIVRVGLGLDGEWAFEVLAQFEEHASMNYGSDVQPRRLDAGDRGVAHEQVFVSTSFYDRRVCLWRFDGRTTGPS